MAADYTWTYPIREDAKMFLFGTGTYSGFRFVSLAIVVLPPVLYLWTYWVAYTLLMVSHIILLLTKEFLL